MAPRTQAQHQIDEISKAIGSIEAYVHEHRHGVNNLSMKMDALALDVARRVEELKTSLSSDIEGIKRRLDALESANDRRSGAVVAFDMINKWAPWLVAMIAGIVAFFSLGGKIK